MENWRIIAMIIVGVILLVLGGGIFYVSIMDNGIMIPTIDVVCYTAIAAFGIILGIILLYIAAEDIRLRRAVSDNNSSLFVIPAEYFSAENIAEEL